MMTKLDLAAWWRCHTQHLQLSRFSGFTLIVLGNVKVPF